MAQLFENDEIDEHRLQMALAAGNMCAWEWDIATGALQPGERLPTVRQLADELDIAPGTVARAYGELERQGVVVAVRSLLEWCLVHGIVEENAAASEAKVDPALFDQAERIVGEALSRAS